MFRFFVLVGGAAMFGVGLNVALRGGTAISTDAVDWASALIATGVALLVLYIGFTIENLKHQ